MREVIERTWGIYRREAWGWDETRPVFGSGRDTRYVLLKQPVYTPCVEYSLAVLTRLFMLF